MISATIGLGDVTRLVSELSTAHVVVLVIDISRFDPLPSVLLGALSAGDQAAAARFRFPADRQRFQAGRGMLRHLLSAAVGGSGPELSVGVTDHGKPYLAEPHTSVQFNVSHSGDLVLVALGQRPLGVDVELERPDRDLPAIAASCFSPAERRDIFALPAEVQARFFRYWTCKEAWIKADGRGLSLPLDEFTLMGLGSGDWRVQHGGVTLPWRVRPLEVRQGYAAAVASTDAPWSVALYTVVA